MKVNRKILFGQDDARIYGADLSEENELKWRLVVDLSGVWQAVVKRHEPEFSCAGRAPRKQL